MNEIIVNLEGKEYQINIQQAKELGILKEKNTKCKSWEEFKLKYKNDRGYLYDSINNEIYSPVNPWSVSEQLTQQEAIAIQAFSKLLKLRRDWIGDWKPDWSNSENKHCIAVCETHIKVNSFCTIQQTFSFPTRKIAEEFFKCFEDLFKQCKNLI